VFGIGGPVFNVRAVTPCGANNMGGPQQWYVVEKKKKFATESKLVPWGAAAGAGGSGK